jgi:uncharacterized sporulation protein YeaH/YhbH (DUF444 family)
MRDKRNVYKILVGKPEENHLRDLGVKGNVTLRRTLRKQRVRALMNKRLVKMEMALRFP